MSLTLTLSLVTVVCCTLLQLCAGFPRHTRQSFFRCSGWGAGCTNMDYGRNNNDHKDDTSEGSQDEDAQKLPYSMPYLFTSGGSWGAMGKRWGPSSWHSDPYLRRILLPYMLSANNNVWVRHYFPNEYLAFKQQFGRPTSVKSTKQKRAAVLSVGSD